MDKEALAHSLVEALATVPDPRSRHGRRHPLPAVFRQTLAAMLSGADSLSAIWHWGRLQEPETVRALGFTRERTPAISSLHELYSKVDVAALETALGAWAREHLDQAQLASAGEPALPGTWGEETPGLQLVAAYAVRAGLLGSLPRK